MVGRQIIKLLRVRQWIKNVFVFAPLIFTLKFKEVESIYLVFKAFVSFCLASSSVYIFNDIIDKHKDKQHPKKKFRPIANGDISPVFASFLSFMFFMLALFIACSANVATANIIFCYFIINFLYTLKLKNIVLVDAFFIALGFILRVYAGAFAINVAVSHWIILTTFFISLFLGFGKRLNEIALLSSKNSHREVLGFYSKELLHNFLIITSTLAIISYALYTIDSEVILKFGTDNLIYTVPFVVFGIFRYLYLVFQKNGGGDVAETVLEDKWIILTCGVWLIFTMSILVFKL